MREISVEDALMRVKAGSAVLVDVRETEEFAAGRAEFATSVPLSDFSADRLPRGMDVLMICRSGARSAKAVGLAQQAGISAFNVAGGSAAWFEAGLPALADGPEPPRVA